MFRNLLDRKKISRFFFLPPKQHARDAKNTLLDQYFETRIFFFFPFFFFQKTNFSFVLHLSLQKKENKRQLVSLPGPLVPTPHPLFKLFLFERSFRFCEFNIPSSYRNREEVGSSFARAGFPPPPPPFCFTVGQETWRPKHIGGFWGFSCNFWRLFLVDNITCSLV